MTAVLKGEKIMKRTLFALICVLTITGACLVTCNYVAPADRNAETAAEEPAVKESVTESSEGLVL